MEKEAEKCPDCWARFIGKHICDSFMKELVKEHKKKK